MHRSIPKDPIVMHQRWESLLFLHWEMDPTAIQETLPPGLIVDTYYGRAYMGIVPFLMRNVRPRFLFCVPRLSDFVELNLRTYVKDEAGRPGVWFYSLDANQSIAVKIARSLFSLPYEHAEMSYQKRDDNREVFSSKRKGDESQVFSFHSEGIPKVSTPGSICEFLCERYRLFSYNRKKKRLLAGEIYHAPYEVAPVEVQSFSKRLFTLNGFPEPLGPPDHRVWASGVDVNIYPLKRVV